MALGIIDWGIGGISIYKLIKHRHPDLPVVYFSDTGVTPYGKMSRHELVTRLGDVIHYLQSQGVTRVVIGCNAASTVIPHLRETGIPIEGVIETAVELVAKTKPKRLGLIGGRRTVLSGEYRRRLTKRAIRVEQRIAQPLSALIESGDVSSPTLHRECERILAPIRNCSHILLACTHYPAITPVLKKYVSEQTAFVDPSSALVQKISKWLVPSGGRDEFLTSGDTAGMKDAALNAFACKIRNPKRSSI